jgi:hypothetical protein
MDNVIVTGHDRQGQPATLELQAKRTIAFTASDKIFAGAGMPSVSAILLAASPAGPAWTRRRKVSSRD